MFCRCSALVASVVLLASTGCTTGVPAVDTSVDVEAVRGIVAGYQQALNAGNLDGCVAMYAPDAVFMPNEGPPQSGLAAIRTYYQETTLLNRFESTFTPTDVQVSGDVAWATVSITGRQTPPGRETYSFESKALFLFRRTSSRTWEVVRYMFNTNAPAAIGAR